MMPELALFQEPEHKPFLQEGIETAVLLVHGFPGTPAEMRPLGASLHRLGWTSQGILLPGFGPAFQTLPDRRYPEWVDAVVQAIDALKQDHKTVIVIGFSMGAALSIHAARQTAVQGLVLAAPFWKLGEWWQSAIGLVLSPFLRSIRPFAKSDFNDPRVRDLLQIIPGGIDLDDPAIQAAFRELKVPVGLIGSIRELGLRARDYAASLDMPTLVLQGMEDDVVTPQNTRRLTTQMPGPIKYVELHAEHQLLDPDEASWNIVEDEVLRFTRTLSEQH